MKHAHNVKIGCCGWSYDDWRGPFYPSDAKAADYLAHYARHFDVVEVDSTFYRPPSPRMVRGWRDRTPEQFRFALKVPRVITHEKRLRDCDDDLEAFLSAARILGDKLLGVCLQFGYFNRQKFAGLRAFLDVLGPFLERWPRDVACAVEIRNRNWIAPRWVEFLQEHHAAMVLVQQTWMPSPAEIIEKLNVATGPFGYVRLLGDRKKIEEITTTWDKVVVDKTDEIRETAEAIRRLARYVPVVVFANNHYAGYGPGTAETLREFLA
jgi:uncharacterized protein YecE (DUF72 family)